jgi:hypothetical protein
LAEQEACSASFSNSKRLQLHLKTDHVGKKFPCPLAKEHHCTATFTTLRGVKNHFGRAADQLVRWKREREKL